MKEGKHECLNARRKVTRLVLERVCVRVALCHHGYLMCILDEVMREVKERIDDIGVVCITRVGALNERQCGRCLQRIL